MMDYDMDYYPPDGLAQALIDGKVDEVTRIFQEAGDNFPVLAYIYDNCVKDSQLFGEPTALTLATQYGHIECVRKILLELGHDYYAFGVEMEVDQRESAAIPSDYFASLIIAFSKGHSEICQLLVEFRLFEAPGVADSYAEFITAVKQSDFVRLESLLDEVVEKEIFLKGWRGHNIMNLCLLFGCPCSCLKKMMDLGIGVNGWDYNGLTPLTCAIIGKNLTCVQFLLDKGAEPYAPHLDHCKLFLADGTITYEESEQSTGSPHALWYAAGLGNIPILKLMLDICTAGHLKFENNKPLSFAIVYANIEAVSLILEYETDREDVDASPAVLAMERDDMKVFEFLLQKVPPSTWKPKVLKEAFNDCVYHSHQYLEKLCALIGREDNFFEMYGGNFLLHAIYMGCLDMVKVVVKLPGFNIDARHPLIMFDDYFGASCFMYSCSLNKIELAKYFLGMGADVNMVDRYQRTPVMNAVMSNAVECLEFLIKANVDLDIKDVYGGTVFSAALVGDGVCLEILLQTKKLFEGDGCNLKPVHRQSIRNTFCNFYDQNQTETISFKAALISIKHKLFDWDWCVGVNATSLSGLMFGAVTSGLSPRKLTGSYDEALSPLMYASLSKSEDLFRYLIANLYFLPCDYQHLLNYFINRSFEFLRRRLTRQPLSLQAWSVLHISQSLVNSSDYFSFPYDRNSKVDALPLPACLKDLLKFKTKFSNLCVSHWQYLGHQRKCGRVGNDVDMGWFNEIVMDEVRVGRFTLENCMDKKCVCQGVGQRVKPVDCQQNNNNTMP